MKLQLFAAFAAFVAAPALAQDTPDALADAFTAAIIAEDADKLASLYTEDADSYGPDGSVVKGRAAIAASWKAFFDAFDGLSASLEKMGGQSNKKNYTAWGLWTIEATPAGGGDKVVMKGRYMDLSVKTKEGWRYAADHASMIAPAN